MIKTALILAGGFGTRLGNLTKKTPKPLIKFNNKSFLDYIISQLVKHHIPKIYILTYYKHYIFRKKYHLKKIGKSQIFCKKEKVPLGTAGTIFNSRKLISNNTIIINGDTYIKIPFKKIENFNLNKKKLLMFLVKNKNYKSNKKLISLNIKNKKIIFVKNNKSNLMNLGLYYLNKNFCDYLNKKYRSLENDILPKLIIKKLVYGLKYNGEFIDIGTKKNLNKFKKFSLKLS